MGSLGRGAIAGMVLLAFPIVGGSVAQTVTQESSFEACLAAIRKVASEHGAPPINIVETNDLRIVRFCSSDGSTLVTCSRPDRKMMVQTSSRKC